MDKINKIFNKKKSLPLNNFINKALYDKEHGYYMTKYPFGKNGDFVTAPLISNLFCEMVSIWCVSFWKYLKEPKKITLVELGPGNGTLSLGLLNTFKKFRQFNNAVNLKLLEVSPVLKKIQKKKIRQKNVKWIKNLNEINSGPVIFICNEFFDSLPIKQFYRKKNIFFEKYVSLSKNSKLKFILKKTNQQMLKKLQKFKLISNNKIIEYPIDSISYLNSISAKINRLDGCLLMIDYGYVKNKNQNTLQSVKNHNYNYILSDVGNSDISYLINFKFISQFLKKKKLKCKLVNQNEFLQKLGIKERANRIAEKLNFKSKVNLYYQLKKLIGYKEMGEQFKVLLATKKNKKFSTGF